MLYVVITWHLSTCSAHIQINLSPTWEKNTAPSFISIRTVQQHRGVTQQTEPGSIFAAMQSDAIWQCAPVWPINYIQAHIPGVLLCNMNSIFLLLPHDCCDKRWKSCCRDKYPEFLYHNIQSCIINCCAVFWLLRSLPSANWTRLFHVSHVPENNWYLKWRTFSMLTCTCTFPIVQPGWGIVICRCLLTT